MLIVEVQESVRKRQEEEDRRSMTLAVEREALESASANLEMYRALKSTQKSL